MKNFFRIKTEKIEIPINSIYINNVLKNEITIWKKRLTSDKYKNNELDDNLYWGVYKYEYYGDYFKMKNKSCGRIYKITSFSNHFLIKLNLYDSFRLKLLNKDFLIFKYKFWYNFVVVVLSLSLLYVTWSIKNK